MSNSKSTVATSLPGGTVIWVFVLVELVTFGLFFLSYAYYYTAEVEVFRSSQEWLHPTMGLINTGVLLTGSWLVARAAHAFEFGKNAKPWLIATALMGCLFTCIKLYEYVGVFGRGVNLSTNLFWFFYIFLTLGHLLHVIAGIGFAAYMAWLVGKPEVESADGEDTLALDIEATATYWHLVDLIWIVLFPLLYLGGAS